ncbi:MAG: tRNA (guanosine(18)-2'-O)-methyltransferase [Chlamydiia bacterium]|nr:tRNA (guanosine(18)-2'-O)-methyltransferase [Chlamydiia bacterium]MCH9618520.1 tRNA (guanosine(18)-2'-O)-methyltransferase [Chlamydiia bacterium]MCH9623809.1 tRNA (guanosine(18)-2'-O)-methyltransferase [Chlamydiia bacterium]
MPKLSNKKFSTLTEKRKHKHAALLLREILEGVTKHLPLYKEYESTLSLTPVENSTKKLLDRIYLHEQKAAIPFPLQYKITKKDRISHTPFLEIDIYLENLRSMHNIGAILRTVEAFRLGKVYISKALPASALEKIKKTAMGSDSLIELHVTDDISSLKKPVIAIETAEEALSCNDFSFPKSFTLLFGNENSGLTDRALSHADHVVNIPLFGSKNSLNVTSAFAILANSIRNAPPHFLE